MDSQNLDNYINEENNSYSLQEFYYIFKKHLKLIVSVFLIVLFSIIYYSLVTKPLYQASSQIMINNEQRTMSLLDIGMGNDRNYIENEVRILKSRTTSELVVRSLLDSKIKNNLFLFESKKYVPNNFRKLLTFGLLDRFQTINEFDDTIVSEKMINKFTDNLMSSITILNPKNTDFLNISIKSYDSKESALLVNALVDQYKKLDLEWVTGEMSHLKNFLTNQLELKEIELESVEKELQSFQEKEKIFKVDDNSSMLLSTIMNLDTEYNKIQAEISIIKERQRYLKNQLSNDEKVLSKEISNMINNRLFALRSELSVAESELVNAITKYDEDHSAVSLIKDKINNLNHTIKKETKELVDNGIFVADPLVYRQSLMDSLINFNGVMANLESKSNAYKSLIEEYNDDLADLPDKIFEFMRLERNRVIHSETYGFMKRKLEESRIGEASKLGKIRVVDRAIESSKPISPNKLVNIIIGIFVGIGVGFLISLIYEFFDNTIKSVEQIERRGFSVLAIIPAIDSKKNKIKNDQNKKRNLNISNLTRRLITHEDPKSPISESYRALRTSLMYSNNNNRQMILISSVGPGEGKTTTIANLAITYANLGKKVILLDSDLRKPVIHNVFKINKVPGLTDFLTENKSFNEIVYKTEINNLDIIPSGVIPPNPSELIDSENMTKLVQKLKENYDIILFDSPPLIAVTDAYLLMKYVSQFALVVRAGVTPRGGLERVISAFSNTSLNISGVIMNAMKEEHSYGAGYYYNYYQYYYGDNDKKS